MRKLRPSSQGFSFPGRLPMQGAMSHEQFPPAYLSAPREVQLRDVADLNRQIDIELAAGTPEIHVVGVESLSYGSHAALGDVARRLAARGVSFEIRRR